MAEIKVISCTGHRPCKLNKEYSYKGPCSEYLFTEIRNFLIQEKPDLCISGMALGADTLFALTALELGIPVLAAIPFKGQESRWPAASQELYHTILNDPLTTQHIVSEGGYSIEKMHIRDRYMVDRASKLLAIYNGSKGGTQYTVKYAIKNDVDIEFIDPDKWEDTSVEHGSLFD